MFCEVDILGLGALVAAAEEQHDCRAKLTEIHSVAWAVIDAKLLHALTDAMAVSKVPKTNPVQPYTNLRPGSSIVQRCQPLTEWKPTISGTIDSEFSCRYLHIVAYKLHTCNIGNDHLSLFCVPFLLHHLRHVAIVDVDLGKRAAVGVLAVGDHEHRAFVQQQI